MSVCIIQYYKKMSVICRQKSDSAEKTVFVESGAYEPPEEAPGGMFTYATYKMYILPLNVSNEIFI